MEPIRHFADAYMPLFGLHTLEVSAFILLVWAVDRRLRLDTRLRYGLWLLALVKVFVPPIFLLPAPPPAPVALPEPVLVEPFASASSQVVEKPALFSLPLSFLGLWVASVLVMAAITVYQNLALRRRLRHATPLTHPLLPSETENGRNGEPVKNPLPASPFLRFSASAPIPAPRLRVFSAATISAPVLVGFRRPRLYLPEGWAAWPEDQLRGILAHELAHLRARDPYVLVLQTLALVLFGLNPLVWVMYTRLTHLRELRCDEAALEQTGIDPVAYSRLLYAFVESQARRPRLAVTGTYFLENHHAILMRLQHILNFKEGAMKLRKWWHYLAPALLALAILPLSIQGFEQRSNLPDTTKAERKPEFTGSQNVKFQTESGEWITVEKAPRPLNPLQPKHPEAARKAGIQGWVQLRFMVDKNGRIGKIETLVGAEPSITQAAIDAVQASVWEPAIYKGEPVSVWVTRPFRFYLIKSKAESGDTIIVDRQPNLVQIGKATYPEVALRDSLEGVVYLNLLIGQDGRTKQVEVRKGPEALHQAAIDAAKASIWEPSLQEGKPVSVWTSYSVPFAVKKGPPPKYGEMIPVDEQPRPIQMPKPVYPEVALKDKLEGVVYLMILVGRDGKVEQVQVHKGDEPFKQAAIDAGWNSAWSPAIYKGLPISVWVAYPIRFTLK